MKETTKDRLFSALDRGELPHGLLFWGENEEALKTLAKEAALRLFSPNDRSRNARLLEEGNLSDYFLLEPKGKTIPIESVREMIRFLRTPPTEAPYKLVVIDRAHKLGEAAANALLKTLEEPSDYALFFVLTKDPEGLLPTIRSRLSPWYWPGEAEEEDGFFREIVKELRPIFRGDLSSVFSIAETLSKEKERREELFLFFTDLFTAKAVALQTGMVAGRYAECLGELPLEGSGAEKMAMLSRRLMEDGRRNVNFRLALEELLLTLWEVLYA